MKNFLKKIRNFIRGYTMTNVLNLFLSKNLKKYWKNCNKNNFDDLLTNSMKKYILSVDYKKTSDHHKLAIIKILKLIENSGNKESSSEFQFNNPNFHSDFSDATISQMIDSSLDNKEPFDDLFKIYPSIKIENSLKLNLINNLIYNKIKNKKIFENIHTLNDDAFVGSGNIYNFQNNLKITQEKLRTLIEYETILPLIKKDNFKIVEIGSGNGRICDCIVNNSKSISKYVLIDIPPALPSAFKRLTKSLKNKKVFFGIDITDQNTFDEVMKNNDIILIFPNQIKFLKQKYFDLFIAIDCLHEMKKNTVKEYMKIAQYTSRNIFFKVHEKAHVPFSFDIYDINNNDYFIDSSFNLIFKKRSLFPSNDWECAYKLN
jgi:putative sugar O-methyltransferase